MNRIKFKNKKLLIILVVLLLGISGYFILSTSKSQVKYLTEQISRSDIEQTVIATGTIESVDEVNVGAQVSGKIIKLYVQLGQRVNKGDKIADIDSTTQTNLLNTKKAALASYRAQLVAKQIDYEVAESSYNRQSKLYKQQSTTLDALNTAKSNMQSAKASVAMIKANIKQAEIEVNTAETNVGYTQITAPMSGTVIAVPVSEGQTVNANQSTPTIAIIADLSKMKVKAEISEGDITKVKAGQKVDFTTLSDNDTVYKSVIDSVDPANTIKTNTTSSNSSSATSSNSAIYYYANVLVDNKNNQLRIGMTTENTIKIAEVKNALLAPNMAVKKQGNKYVVNVLNNSNEVETRTIKIGIQNDLQTEIKSGVKEGERVIVSTVEAGEKVGSIPRNFKMF